MKHTKGPWRVGDAGHAVFGPKDSGMYPNAPVTILQNLANKGNAHLIAAAPEMFEALLLAEKYFDDNGGHEAYTWLPKIKSALAKARGDL